jgi:tripeptide aminopeptidase
MPGYRLEPGDPAVAMLYSALNDLGLTPDPHPVGGGTDGNVFRGRGIAAVTLGRGSYAQHTKEEYLLVPELLETCRVVERLVRLG